jgi:hypothetical protein
VLVGAQWHLRAVGPRAMTRGRPTWTRRPPSVTSPDSCPVPDRAPLRVVLALRTGDVVDFLLEQLAQHAQPDTDA